ncbi:hypothetical protein LCGC14_2689550, partial [marine sediment metagenome]
MTRKRVLTGARIFDGTRLLKEHALLIQEDGKTRILPWTTIPETCDVHTLDGGMITAGFVDLQVNGGGGVMFNAAPSLETVATIASAHCHLGTAG